MGTKIFSLGRNNKPKKSTTSGKSASGKSRNLKTLERKMIRKLNTNKGWCIIPLLGLAISLSAQTNLIQGPGATRVNEALAIVATYEPDMYQTVVKASTLQLGELSPQEKGTCWNVNESTSGQPILWIMLHPDVVTRGSVNRLAGVILHEAMHLLYGIYFSSKDWDSLDPQKDRIEHTTIYNYELFFLQKIGASAADLSRQKRLMRAQSIPVL